MGNKSKKKMAQHNPATMIGTGAEPALNSTQEVVGDFVAKLVKLRQENPELQPTAEEQAAAAGRLRAALEGMARASETVQQHLDRIGVAYSINETANILVIDMNKLAEIENGEYYEHFVGTIGSMVRLMLDNVYIFNGRSIR